MQQTIKVKNLNQLSNLAKKLQKLLIPQTIVLLNGNLGTGKTSLIKKLMSLYGLEEKEVKSPTFSLINIYQTELLKFYHLDLYRLDQHDRFLLEEIKEILAESNSIVLIEWPENMELKELYAFAKRLIEIKINFAEHNFRNFLLCVK